ncbi:uncharacterized protein LTR77_009607 [Saxophila tyrrhenica]|uniref:NmrA-like domain-containing protein n=1 Tax=Saxophila tyrrhenica TaxID=1690608 RepID=A0AAV9NYP4_9PEZI|nr:hypothetical protein LTR77_009607 [Saxophila tyrrhenica]
MARTKVGLVGASGETGASILNGLLEDGSFEIIALVRPSSMSRPSNVALKDSGIELRALDLDNDSQDKIVAALEGIEILLSAVGAPGQLSQLPLATAAKTAGVKRFVPCGYVTVIPPGGVHILRDQKEEVYNLTRRLNLPYTFIDCGWWYQISFPKLPSGKIDYAVMVDNPICGKGDVPSALTDLRDVGRYVAKVIRDERTLNKMVLVYDEVWTQKEVWDLLEKVAGEKVERKYVSQEELEGRLGEYKKAAEADPTDFMKMLHVVETQYLLSWGVRGDNTPEYAKYLGYITSKELYPDFKPLKLEDFARELVAGEAKEIYVEMKAMMKAAFEKQQQQQ